MDRNEQIEAAIVIQKSFRKYLNKRQSSQQFKMHCANTQEKSENSQENKSVISNDSNKVQTKTIYEELQVFYEKLSVNAGRQKYVENLFDEIEGNIAFLKNIEHLNNQSASKSIERPSIHETLLKDAASKKHNIQLTQHKLQWWEKL